MLLVAQWLRYFRPWQVTPTNVLHTTMVKRNIATSKRVPIVRIASLLQSAVGERKVKKFGYSRKYNSIL